MTNKDNDKKKFKSKFRDDALTKQAQTALVEIEPQIRKAAEMFAEFNTSPLQNVANKIKELLCPIELKEMEDFFSKVIDISTFQFPKELLNQQIYHQPINIIPPYPREHSELNIDEIELKAKIIAKATVDELSSRFGSQDSNISKKNLENVLVNIFTEKNEKKLSKKYIQYKDGKFHCKGKQIDFPSENAIYVLLVKALFHESDEKGFCSYKRIDSYFVNAGKEKIKDKTTKEKRILNAMQNLCRDKRKQINPFPKNAPDGQLIIRVQQGEGLIFYNPETKNKSQG